MSSEPNLKHEQMHQFPIPQLESPKRKGFGKLNSNVRIKKLIRIQKIPTNMHYNDCTSAYLQKKPKTGPGAFLILHSFK